MDQLLCVVVVLVMFLIIYRMFRYKYTKYNLENIGLMFIAYLSMYTVDYNRDIILAIKVVLLMLAATYFFSMFFIKSNRNKNDSQ